MRRLVACVCVLFLLEAALYSTLAPLLAYFARTLGLSSAMAGILTAAYAAGVIPGGAASDRIAAHLGDRGTIICGLVVLGVSTIAFGVGDNVFVLVLTRGVQGVAAGCVWGGALAWLNSATPERERGRLIGTAFSAATFGTLLGPILGSVASTVSRAAVFGAIGILSFALIAWVLAVPSTPHEPRCASPLIAPYRNRALLMPMWLVTLQAIPIGLLTSVVPLQLSGLGSSKATVAVTFLGAAAFGSIIGPVAGRSSDRRGRTLPIGVGLALAAPCLLAEPLPASIWAVMTLTICTAGVFRSMSLVPAVALITDKATRARLASAVPAIVLMDSALGELVGAAGGSGLAQATIPVAPFVVLAVLYAATAAVLATRPRASPEPAHSA